MRLFSRSPRPATKTAHLHLESLEERAVPTAGFEPTFVALTFHTLLRRDADPAGLAAWTNVAEHQGLDAVVRGIQESPEHQRLELNDLYTGALGRPATEAELESGMTQIQAGRRFDQIEADVYGSDEFFTRVGRTQQGLLNAIYENELGRGIDPGALQYWEGRLTDGVPAREVDLDLCHSDESVGRDIRTLYTQILGRGAGDSEVGFWLTTELHGRGRDDLVESMLGSTENRNKLQATLSSPPQGVNADDPNALAHACEDTYHLGDDRQGHGGGEHGGGGSGGGGSGGGGSGRGGPGH
jgi:hypothetical protein